MPVYSPPLTRLRARVLFIAEQQQQQQQQEEQQQASASDEKRRRQPGQTTRERRRPHPQQQQQRAGTEESEKPEKAFLSKRAAGTVDSRSRASQSQAESRRTATSGTQGNTGSRCKKGLLGRQVRKGSRDSDPTAEVDRGDNDHTEEADHQQQMMNNGEAKPESVCTSSTSSSESVSSAGGTTSEAPSQGSNCGQLQDSGCGPGDSPSGEGVGLCRSNGSVVASGAVGAGVENGESSTEMRGLTGLRQREKAEKATGDDEERVSSTGASPLQKRNRRELKLSQDEVAMAGAPQGPVYQVKVLETSEFEESPNPEEEMKAVHAAAGGGEDWADIYSAVDSTRRLAIFHAGVLSRTENLEGAVGLLVSAVGNLRSSMVRNALLAVRDMFRCLGEDVGKVDIRAMVTCTLQRMAGDKRFISQTAAQAMEAATRNGPAIAVLEAVLVSIDDRNAEVSAKAALFAEQCLGTLGVGSKAGVGMPENLEFQPLVAGLGRAFGGKLAEGRTAARRGLLRSRKAMGPERFQSAVTAGLPKAEAQSLLAALAVPNGDGARARGGKSSIRQHMLAARKENKEQRPVDGGKCSGAGFVIVT